MYFKTIDHPPKRVPKFGAWLRGQHKREDAIGALARAAQQDPRFPLDGGYETISRRLHQLEADVDMHEALDEAESEWRSDFADA